jgi:hypothetical protein
LEKQAKTLTLACCLLPVSLPQLLIQMFYGLLLH